MSAPVPTGATRFTTSLKRSLALTASLAIAVLALTFAPAGGTAFAATQDFAQCNGILEGGGKELKCDVTVTNNLNLATGEESSTVTTTVCEGPNGASICGEPVTKSYDLITKSVDQCNGSVNGGGATLTCNVTVVNNITGAPENTGTTGATVNQCNYSGGGGGTAPTLDCDPTDAKTSGATITQCNGSVNGGGAPERVTCSVLPSTASAELPVSINQCNDSANGGGSLATCTASLTNNITAAVATTPIPVETTPIPVATVPLKNTLYDAKTDGFNLTSGIGADGTTAFVGAGVLMLIAGGLLTVAFATRKAGTRQ